MSFKSEVYFSRDHPVTSNELFEGVELSSTAGESVTGKNDSL